MADFTVFKPSVGATDYPTKINGLIDSLQANCVQDGDIVPATSISNTPAGNIAATTVQAAINELDTEKAGLALANTFTQPQTVTVSSTSAALTVTQTGTGNAFVVEDVASDTTPFVIDVSGKVLSGKTSEETTGDQWEFHSGGGVTGAGLGVYNWNASGSYGPNLRSYKSLGGTVGTRGTVASGTLLSRQSFYGDDGVGFIEAARIDAAVDGTPGINDMPGRLVFSTTADGSASPSERMRIDSNGNIAIGTTSAPSQATSLRLFHNTARNLELTSSITDATSKTGRISVTHYTSAEEAFNIVGGTSNGADNIVQIGGGSATLNAATALHFYTAADPVTLTGSIKAKLDSNGDFYLSTPALMGYGVGAGGVVTQTTSRTTGVTINKPTGAITLVSAAGSATPASFTVTNSLVGADSRIIVNQVSGTDLYEIHITAVATGSFRITFKTTGGTTTEQPVFSFTVIKGINS